MGEDSSSSRRSIPGGDGRDFTEAEYARELSMHGVKLKGGELASVIYSKAGREITDRPRTGVFRDFQMYGVHPARVVVQHALLTVPFLVSVLTADQLATEITNQKARTEKRKPDTRWSEEEAAAAREDFIVDGQIVSSPSPDSAYELIDLLKKRKSFIPYTPPLARYLHALNLYVFVYGSFSSVCSQYVTPQSTDVIAQLLPLVMINKKAADGEIAIRQLNDPAQWGRGDPSKARPIDVANLLIDAMTTTIQDSALRKVVDWFKLAHLRMQFYKFIHRILLYQSNLLSTVMLTRSLTETRSR